MGASARSCGILLGTTSRTGLRTRARAATTVTGSSKRRGCFNEQSGGARATRERRLWPLLCRVDVSVGVRGCRVDHRVWCRRREVQIRRVFSVHGCLNWSHLSSRASTGGGVPTVGFLRGPALSRISARTV